LKIALSAKLAQNRLVVVDRVDVENPKTKNFVSILKNFGWDSVLMISGADVSRNVQLASGNVHFCDVLPARGLNVYDILRRKYLVLSSDAIKDIELRFSPKKQPAIDLD
jgi:large subunit ribosomal protein L4